MFSGITRGCYPVVACTLLEDRLDYTVQFSEALCQQLTVGNSVSVNGVCQTVTHLESTLVSFQAIAATLQCTTLKFLKKGDLVSVERSLRVSDEIGGHFLSGHISDTGRIVRKQTSASTVTLTIQCAPEWMKFCFPKGFIALDGSSLTLGHCDPLKGQFDVHLIPETLKTTLFASKNPGDLVNIEIDALTQLIVQTVENTIKARRRRSP